MNRPDRLVNWLDGPSFVRGAFVLFMIGILGLILLLWNDQREQVDRIDQIVAERVEEANRARQDQVDTCFARANQGPAIQRALEAIASALDTAKARQAVEDFRLLNKLNTPTFRECRQLAGELNVPLPKGIR